MKRKNGRPKRTWTSEELEYIRQSYGRIPLTVICKELKTSRYTIKNAIEQLGHDANWRTYQKHPPLPKLTDCQKQMLCRFMATLNIFADTVEAAGKKPDARSFMDAWHYGGGV